MGSGKATKGGTWAQAGVISQPCQVQHCCVATSGHPCFLLQPVSPAGGGGPQQLQWPLRCCEVRAPGGSNTCSLQSLEVRSNPLRRLLCSLLAHSIRSQKSIKTFLWSSLAEKMISKEVEMKALTAWF